MYSIVIPLFNEEEVLKESYKKIKKVMDSIEENYELIFVNDGSKDNTLDIVKKLITKDKNIKFLSFSRNFGHQLAITAGMKHSTGEAVVVIDADLQDPPEIIIKMIEKWKIGYDVVYGKRVKRKGETLFKKLTAKIFYRFLDKLTDVDIPVDTGDFRLIDRKVCIALNAMPERSRYVRGLISWLGFKQTAVEFIREERFAGETKYPFKKMIKFALDAITSFSYKPLKLTIYFGVTVSFCSFIYLLIILFEKIFTINNVPGWTTIVALSLFFSGIMFCFMGIIGEYVGRIYEEVKGRPLFVIAEKGGFNYKLTSNEILKEEKIS
jgi:dolichol-phosphate mannosyltransferase